MLEEFKALLKSPKLIITMIGVALVPALYNLSFLGSMWNPYGNAKDLPIAVVNKDKSAQLDNKKLTIGDDMVDTMSKNKALDYHFVSEKKANKGLDEGNYYMIITLPENLSQKATTLLEEKPEKLAITYQTSRGHSMVASKISETAIDKLRDKVSENITRTYTNAVFKSINKLQSGLQEASEGSNKLASGANQAKDGSQKLSDNLNTLSQSTQAFTQGANRLNSGLTTYTGGVTQLNTGLYQMSSQMPVYLNGVSQLAEGANKLNLGLTKLANGTTTSKEDAANIQTLIVGLPKLNAGINELNDKVQSISVPNVDGSKIVIALTSIASAAQGIIASESQTKANQVAALEATATYKSLSPEQQAELTSAITTTPSSSVENAKMILANVKEMQTTLASLALPKPGELSQIEQLKAGVNELTTKSNIALPGATTALTKLSMGLNTVNSALTNEVVPGSSQLSAGLAQLSTKNQSINSGISKLYSGSSQLDSKSGQLLDGSSQISSGAEKISSGAGKLTMGSNTLTGGLTELSTGLTTLQESLRAASSQLSLVSVKDSNAKAIANPVKLKAKDKDQVKNNGIAMTPYMVSVSLMVVALSTNVIFATSLSGRPVKNRWEWAKQKFVINGFISTLGSILLYVAIHFLGFEANYEMKTLGFIFLSGWTLMALVTALVGWDDRYGSFASLVMLLLQVGSAGGSYPIELSDKFFRTLHPYLPMTYVVSGLRQTISLKGQINPEITILTAFLLAFMIMALVIYRPKKTL
ncbi:YhgE/Pip domain-containing protein [Streptococcus didelphis]|uniref:YhgE/Pip domain-containing protein n=1 Tax=Streptococcus didelphis TaxID=102886 RepID=A0ABY9LFE5_9STRE|nr:YhgE/Pip domain-containing protein [Streptococcus didelphis]WMB27650.1 YhgE/Pip domain-containing protein [Streptococcus didelphis]